MENLSSYTEAFDVLFKFIGILVAVYIAPIKKSITELNASVHELNKNMAVMFEKHDKSDSRIGKLENDSEKNRERIDDILNHHVLKIEKNAGEIKAIKEKIAQG